MKNHLQKTLYMCCKFLSYQVILQIIFISVLLANETNAQKNRSVRQVFIDLKTKEVNITDVFREIESTTNFKFFYDRKVIDKNVQLAMNYQEASVYDILLDISKQSGLRFKQINNTINVKKTDQKSTSEEIEIIIQSISVSGTVTDSDNNEPLPGVNIIEKGTTNGTVTDIQGRYSIDVEEEGTLVISSVGYETIEIPVSGQSQINISLAPDIQSLSEIVVVGYGTQERKEVTGSVVSLSSKEIKDLPVPNVLEALSGQMSGVQVQQVSGAPGSDPIVRVRGIGSISAGNDPLIVIDGYPVSQSNLSLINPNDIESIDVLKDASAAAIYGSRGGNGVVLITTKKGTAGKTQVNIDAWTGFQDVPQSARYDMLNATEFAEWFVEARNYEYVYREGGNISDPNNVRPANYTIPPEFQNISALGEGTDWQEEIFQVAPMQNINLSASGGNESIQFAVSGNYMTQEGIIINSNFDRYSFRANLNGNLTDKLTFGLNLAPSYAVTNEVQAAGQWWGQSVLGAALVISPHFPVRNDDGTYADMLGWWPYTGGVDNPVRLANDIKDKTTEFRLFSNLNLEYEIIKNLKFKTSLGIDLNSSDRNYFKPSTVGFLSPPPSVPSARSEGGKDINWISENTLTYDKEISGGHHITALLGYTAQKGQFESYLINATNFPNDQVQTLNAGQITGGNTLIEEWSLISYLGRINYDFKDKYLLTVSFRRDGSSRFGTNNKWGTFPSASAGWRISEEAFMQNQSLISDLKLRVSYGLTGNNSIPNYGSIGLLSSTNYISGSGSGGVVTGLSPSTLSNPGLGWEKNKQTDVGIEVGLFKNRLSFEIDYYQRNTSDLLLNVPIPSSLGFTQALVNIGEIENKGWEIATNAVVLDGPFKWNASFNIFTYKNKILKLGPEGDPINVGTHISEIGQPMGMFYGYNVLGIYNTQTEVDNNPSVEGNFGSVPGDLWYEDVSDDGVINSNDRTVIGNPWPDFVYGMTNTFSFSNIDLRIFFQGVQGNDIYSVTRTFTHNLWGNINASSEILNRWKSPDEPGNSMVPHATMFNSGSNDANSSRFIQDGSFLRIRNITLGYTFPVGLVEKLLISNLRIYASVQNLHTFTNYEGYNPEINTNGGDPLRPGTDNLGYPVPRTISFGVNLTF